MHLQKLMDIVENNHAQKPFSCIKDLVTKGLSVDRFTEAEHKPQRHEITLFLASWCRRIGLEPETYRDWLVASSVEILSVLSASPASKIRHSTKSSIKYIHRSEVSFLCGNEKNIFKAACSSDCPVYEEMRESFAQHRVKEQKKIEEEEERQRLMKIEYEKELAALPPKKIGPKQKYKKQFEEALVLIKQHIDEGRTKKAISALLNEKEYKTSTGSSFNPSSVSNISSTRGWTPKRPRSAKPEFKKEHYTQQFEEAVLLIHQLLDEGYTRKAISALLNEKGYKTSTGYDYKPGIVTGICAKNGWSLKRKKRKKPEEKKDAPDQLPLFK